MVHLVPQGALLEMSRIFSTPMPLRGVRDGTKSGEAEDPDMTDSLDPKHIPGSAVSPQCGGNEAAKTYRAAF